VVELVSAVGSVDELEFVEAPDLTQFTRLAPRVLHAVLKASDVA